MVWDPLHGAHSPPAPGSHLQASGPLRFQLGLAVSLQQQHDVAEPLFEQVHTCYELPLSAIGLGVQSFAASLRGELDVFS